MKKKKRKSIVVDPSASSYNEDMSLRISALSDIVFKYIFGTEKSTDVLKSFINAVQKDREFPEIDSLIIRNPINEKTFLDDKISIIDIKARDSKGDWYIVEVQIRNQPFFQERSLYYWARSYADQLPEGREYMHLDRVISISILDCTIFPEHIPFHSCFMLREKDHPDHALTLDCVMHYLEIPKIKEKPDSDILRWLYYLRHAGEEDENMEELLKKDRAIYQADERYKQFLANEKARLAYQSRQMFLHDQATLLGTERREARAEGREEGREEGLREGEHAKAIETARRLMDRGMSISETAEITGLSKKEVENLVK